MTESRYCRAQRVTWEILDGDPTTGADFRWIDLALLSVVIANVLAVVVGTVPSVERAASNWLAAFELFSVAVFSVEYLLRLWSAPARPEYARPVGR